jgi:hypothetical protein
MTWSLSRLKTFEQCAAKYDYRYRQQVPVTDTSSPAAARGVKIHKEIEQSLNDGAPMPMEASFLTDIPAGGHPEFTVKLDREWKQAVAGDYWYHGIIDLYVRTSETTATIYDWKTGKIYPDHEDQKSLYALVLMCIFPELQEVKTIFSYLDLRKQIPKVFHPHSNLLAKETWNARVAKMEGATEFIPSPGYLCRYCAYSRSAGGPCRF